MTEILTLPVEPKSVVWNPSPEQLRRFTEEMPNCRKTEFGNVNVATRVVSRSKGSTFVATDTPENHSDQTISRAEYERMAKLQNDYIRTRDMLVVDGFIGNDPQFRVAGAPDHREGEREHRRHAAASLLSGHAGGAGELRADGHGHLHAESEGRGISGRAADRGRSRQLHHPRLQLRLLRRVEEGRAADVEQDRLRARRPGAARGLQSHSGRRREQGRPHRRTVGHRQDDDDLHEAEQLAAGAGRLLRADAGRQGLRDRERLLRQDVRPQSEG